jgi:hypothetical protein
MGGDDDPFTTPSPQPIPADKALEIRLAEQRSQWWLACDHAGRQQAMKPFSGEQAVPKV